MSDITIFGLPPSSYVRTVRILCEEKGISYDIQPVELGSEAHKKLHPFGKMPAMKHGDVHLFETAAICTYLDNVFDGPTLVPGDAKTRAQMDQWISAIDCYIYPHLIPQYALKYIFAPEGGPDREAIDNVTPLLNNDIAMLDGLYAGSKFMFGDDFTLGDAFVAPIINTVKNFPEAQAALKEAKNLMRAYELIEGRASFKAAHPQQ